MVHAGQRAVRRRRHVEVARLILVRKARPHRKFNIRSGAGRDRRTHAVLVIQKTVEALQ